MEKRMKKAVPYLPLELVAAQILLRLPVESLLRFTCVCKAWRDLIAGDSSFHRAHLRLQNSCLLIAPQIESNSDDDGCCPPELNAGLKTMGFYRWEQSRKDDATLVPAMPDSCFSLYRETMHDLAHCDGLILVPANTNNVCVINPATRRVLTLPRSTHISKPRLNDDQHAFGLGHDPRSNTYKVARFFCKSLRRTSPAGHHTYTLGMEVYALGGADQRQQRQWRETATPPPYPVMPGRTATFFKGSLFWTIEEFRDTIAAPGFVRFSLEDESFSVMAPPPPCRHRINYAASSLAELHGELCLCVPRPDRESLEIWMCHDLDHTWDRRHVIAPVVAPSIIRVFVPVVADADAIVVRTRSDLFRCDRKNEQTSLKSYVVMENLRYHDHPADTDILVQCQRRINMVVPYIPSLVSI